MNSVITKIEDYKHKQIQKELERLENHIQIIDKWYAETNLSKFVKQKQQCQKEIEELKLYLNGSSTMNSDIIGEYDRLKDILTIVEEELKEIAKEDSGYRTKSLIKYIEDALEKTQFDKVNRLL